MSDIALQMVFTPQGVVTDLVLQDGDLLLDETLNTSVLVSLFTNKRVTADDPMLIPGIGLGGWWGDMHPQVTGDQIGSKLWLLYPQKSLPVLPSKAVEYGNDGLEWMVEDGVADDGGVDVTAAYSSSDGIRQDVLLVEADISQPGGGGAVNFKYYYQWQAQRLLVNQ